MMVVRRAHNPQGRFDSEAPHPGYNSVNSTVGIHSTITILRNIM